MIEKTEFIVMSCWCYGFQIYDSKNMLPNYLKSSYTIYIFLEKYISSFTKT